MHTSLYLTQTVWQNGKRVATLCTSHYKTPNLGNSWVPWKCIRPSAFGHIASRFTKSFISISFGERGAQDLCSNHLLYALQLLISCFTRNLLITHGISGVGRGSYGSLAATMSRCRLSRTTEDIKHRVQAIRINLSQRMALMGEVWWCDDCFHSFGPKICGSLIASTYQAMKQTPPFFTDLSHWTGAKMVFPFRTSLEFVPRLIQVENSSGKLVWSSNRRTFQLARSCSVVGKNSVLKLSILNKLHVVYMRILKHLRLKRRKTSFHHLNCEVSNPWFQGLLLFADFPKKEQLRPQMTETRSVLEGDDAILSNDGCMIWPQSLGDPRRGDECESIKDIWDFTSAHVCPATHQPHPTNFWLNNLIPLKCMRLHLNNSTRNIY